MQKITIILLLLISSIGQICAQQKDSLVLKLEGNSHLLIILDNLNQLNTIQNVNALVEKLDQDLLRLKDDIEPSQPAKVSYQVIGDQRTIQIKQPNERIIAAYTSEEEIVKGKSAPDSIFVSMPKYDHQGKNISRKKLIFIVDYLEDFAKIPTLDIDSRLTELKEQHKDDPGPMSFGSNYAKYEYPLASGAEGAIYPKVEPDYLSFNSTGGINLIRDKWAPDLGLRVRAHLYSKNKMTRLIIGAGINWYGFFEKTETGYETNINTFVSLYGKLLFGDGTNPDIMSFGLGVGYLTKERGDYFGKNTFKVFAPITIGNTSLSLTPELYITDQFKTVFPAFRIGVGF